MGFRFEKIHKTFGIELHFGRIIFHFALRFLDWVYVVLLNHEKKMMTMQIYIIDFVEKVNNRIAFLVKHEDVCFSHVSLLFD